MKSPIRATRLFLPREDFEKWAVPPCNCFDEAFWERVAEGIGDAPSAFQCVLPPAYSGTIPSCRAEDAKNAVWSILEKEALVRLGRGFMLVERSTKTGVRYGIVAAIDLEAYSANVGETSPIRPSERPRADETFLALREQSPMEFPTVMLFYRDKGEKLVRHLKAQADGVEYDFPLAMGGGQIKGYFFDESFSEEIADGLYTRGEPLFTVAAGHDELYAAKLHWEKVKQNCRGNELYRHPARFTLVEFVNLLGANMRLLPVHRVVLGVEREVFHDYFMRNFKCKRMGNVLFPALRDAVQTVARTDEIITAYLRANGGYVSYVSDENVFRAMASKEDAVGVALGGIEAGDLFPALKGGQLLPRNLFRICEERELRYHLEGREISYD